MRFQLPLALLAALPVACMDRSDSSEVDQVTVDLEKAGGGFTTADEAAQFGEDDLYAAAAIEPAAVNADELATDPTVVDLESRAGVDAHDFAIIWGQLPADPTATPRDWSGSLTVSRGALLVRHRIGFEPATDRVMPRTDPQIVAFRSITRPFVDGLTLRVLDPTPGDAAPLTLTYTSADNARTYTLALARLADGPIVVDAGDGDKVIAAGRRRNDSCSHGAMRGRWHELAPHAGVYLGVVANASGEVIGHVRGIFGQRRSGESVVFGKFIDRDGAFTGVIDGHFGDGRFEARWLDRAGDHGVLKGAFFDAPTLRGGGFVARWAETSCDR